MTETLDREDCPRESVEMEIQSTKEAIKGLHARLYHLHEKLNRTSPILRRLPPETMVEIFTLVVDSHYNPLQFTLGHVCRAWREIVWNTPRLWRHVYVYFREDRIEAQRHRLEECIARSGNQLIDVDLGIFHYDEEEGIGTPPEPGVEPWDPPEDIFQILLKASERWYSLEVCGFPFIYLRSAMLKQQYSFPHLSRIHIQDLYNDTLQWSFGSCPSLQELTATDTEDTSLIHVLDAPRLRTLDAAYSQVRVCLKALGDFASSLTTCDLSLAGSVDMVLSLPSKAIFLPLLKDLFLESKSSRHGTFRGPRISSILHNITAPSMACLRVAMDSDFDKELPTHLLAFVRRSQCHLTSLSFYQPSFSETDLVQLLHHLPSLTDLKITKETPTIYFSRPTIDLLDPEQSESPSSQESLPNLTRFTYSGPISFEPGELINMIHSRRFNTACEMESLSILYCNKDWAQKQNPNKLLEFHHELVSLGLDSDSGVECDSDTKIRFHWDPLHGY